MKSGGILAVGLLVTTPALAHAEETGSTAHGLAWVMQIAAEIADTLGGSPVATSAASPVVRPARASVRCLRAGNGKGPMQHIACNSEAAKVAKANGELVVEPQ
jgi:hypothetical protein